MSNPTRYQRWPHQFLSGRLGQAEPQEPDPDPEDPTDYASQDEGGAVQVGIDVGSPGLVQDQTAHAGSITTDVTAIFDNPPEVGNTLIAVLINRSIGESPTTPSGWTRHPAETTSQAGDGGRLSFFYKVAQPGESDTVTINCGQAKDLYIAEWSGLGEAMATSTVGWSERINAGATTSMSTISITPTASRGVLFAGFVQAAREPTLTLGSFTDVFNVDVDPSGPAGALGYQITDPFTGSYQETCASSDSDTYGAIMVGFAAATEDTVWFPAPAANDGDTATSAFSDSSGPTLRVALEVERLIYHISLDVGQASAGATVYELYGSDDAAFTSPVLLTTLSFTATGSYTLDTVEASWMPAATYAYFQLEHVSGGGSDREFYEVRLLGAVGSTGGVTSHPALTDRDEPEQHPADAIEVNPAVDGETDAQGALENHETRIDALEAAGGDVDAEDVNYVNDDSGLVAQDVQAAIDELAASLWGVDTLGSLTAGGSPVAITNDSSYNAFPGVARLDPRRVLLVYRKGTDHVGSDDGRIVGKIGTLAAGWASVTSWGTEFEIYNHASLDVRCEDAVAVIDGAVYVSGRHYDDAGSGDNQLPFVLICDDPADTLTSASTWTKHDIDLTTGSDQNYTSGHVVKIASGEFLQPVGWDSAGTHAVGVAIVTDPTDWSAPTFVTVGSGANDYAEIGVIMWPDGTLRAHFNRAAGAGSHYWAESTDDGATWTSPAVLFTGIGYPAFRRLASGLHLTIYRSDTGAGDTAWREGDVDDANYTTETILDATGTTNEYATLLQLTPTKILGIYAIENSSTDADVRSQIFTDSSTFGPTAGASVTPSDTVADETTWGITPDAGVSDEYSRGDHTHGSPEEPTGTGGVGPILISDTHSTPLVFADLLQTEAGDDLLYDDP